MPCYRCGTRQVDPDRGASPWARGVRRGHQVLICPGCQESHDWAAEFDRCSECGSAHLVRRLDEVECRHCGLVELALGEPVTDAVAGGHGADGLPGVPYSGGADPALADEVERALKRVLGRRFQAVPAVSGSGGGAGARRRSGTGA